MVVPLRFQSWAMSVNVSTRCLAPVLGIIVFVYIVVYLLWADPASRVALRHHHNREAAKSRHGQNISSLTWGNEVDLNIVMPPQQFIPHGKGIWIPERSIQVMSAIRDIHHQSVADEEEMRLVLPAFLQHSSNRNFFCCLHWSDDAREFIQVPARLDYIDLRYMVELQSAAFECLVKRYEVKNLQRLTHVSFASESCDRNPTLPLNIVTPSHRKFEFAVCTKVAYGRLDPQRLLEWFSFMELMGASKVLTFYNNVHNDTMRVFRHFANTGLLQLIKFDPRGKGGKSVRYTEQNAQTRQAQHDKTLAVRDCQYRLGGYDFIMTIDFDELPVPLRPFGSINWVLQSLWRNHTDAAAFRMEPVLLPPGSESRKDPALYYFQFVRGAPISPYCNKWVYAPGRSWMAATHEVFPKEGYKTYVVPSDLLHFLHFRSCKPEWHKLNCSSLSHKLRSEDSLLRFADRVVYKLRRLPLQQLLPPSIASSYARVIREDSRGGEKLYDHLLLLNSRPFLN